MDLKFKLWFENIEAKKGGIKDTILDFLKDKLNIDDEEEILSMQLSSIDQGVINSLMSRGIIQNAPDDLMQDIKNGSMTVGDMVNRLAGDQKTPLLLPFKRTNPFSNSQLNQTAI